MIAKKNRLPQNEILRVLRSTKPINAPPFRVHIVSSSLINSRLALSIPKKVVNLATARNRWKRIISESLNGIVPRIEPIDGVIVLVTDIKNYNTQKVTHVLELVFKNKLTP